MNRFCLGQFLLGGGGVLEVHIRSLLSAVCNVRIVGVKLSRGRHSIKITQAVCFFLD